MTGMLKQVMHERADELGHSPVDLDAVLRDADRRIRRRRIVAVAAGAASVVAVAALATQFIPSGGRSTQVTDGSDAVPYAISYASGETIHVGESELDVGHPIRAYVQTDAGYVFTSTDRAVYTFVDGTAERVGSLGRVDKDQTELVADGPRVAWVDEQDGVTVLDVGSGEVSHTAVEKVPGMDDAPQVTALDGTTAYFVDARGVVVWDSATGAVTVRGITAPRVVDAEAGLLLTKGAEDDGKAAIVSPAGSVPVELDRHRQTLLGRPLPHHGALGRRLPPGCPDRGEAALQPRTRLGPRLSVAG